MGKLFIFCCSILLLLAGCGTTQEPEARSIVARYKNSHLTTKDLRAVLPENISAVDSQRLAHQFIEEWLNHEIISQKMTLTPEEQERITWQTEQYRKTLIANLWAKKNAENADSVFSMDTLRQSYEKHKQAFITPVTLVQYRYISSPEPEGKSLRTQIVSENKEDIIALKGWCNAKGAKLELDSAWRSLSEMGYIQSQTTQNISQLKPKSYVMSFTTNENGKTTYHYLYITDQLKAGTPLPLSSVKSRLISLLRNQRKNEIIQRLQGKLVNEALESKEAEMFTF